ncbi:MAG: ATP-binding protein [Promethearchaeota archaeon]|jgi:hypothetical protein
MGIIGYRTKILITKVLPIQEDILILDKEKEYYHNTDSSWLCDPFGDNITYGTRFNINSGFSWEFFLHAETSEKAEELGNAFLFYLQEKYKGLNGEISVTPLHSEFLEIKHPLYEIIIPSHRILKLPFLRKLINYYKSPHRKIGLNMFIFWKKDDLGNFASRFPDPTSYRIKIFVSFNSIKENFMNFDMQIPAIKTVLRYMISDMTILPDGMLGSQRGLYKELSISKWKDIFTCNVFPSRIEFLNGEIPREDFPKLIKPENVDFTIPNDIPLPRPPILENRNITNLPISKEDDNYIYFGNKMIDGVLSNEIATIEIDLLNNHLEIFGKTGKGKSTLIKIIINELRRKRPDIGILIVNLADPNLVHEVPTAKVYNFPSEKLRIPYIVLGSRAMKSMRGFGNVLAACLGLKYIGPVLITETLQRCYKEYGEFPHHINEFFDQVEKNLQAKPYDPDTQRTILMAFKRRINELFHNKELVNNLRLSEGNSKNIPDWYLKWRNGNLVILNLTELDDIKEQPLIVMLIFKMVEILTHFDNSKVLNHLICLDEAHRALGRPRDRDPESVEFLMKNKINSLFSNIIEECRKKGLGILVSEQKPHLLLESAIDSASIRILFSLGYPSNEIFTGNIKEREMLLGLKPRYALVLNDLTEERYLCKTADEIEFKI